jgi:B9 domain-containing protein 1
MNRASKTAGSESSFYLMANGQVESAVFSGGIDNLYCRYAMSFGNDWGVIHGVDSGLSQIARMDQGSQDQSVTWNFPIDVTFKATNAFGWPRLALSIYGVDGMGRDVVRGYGSMLLPTTPGRHVRYVHTYTPLSSSILQRFMAWMSGTHPEFFDSKFVTQGEGREVTRVKNTGVVKVTVNVMTKGMESFGYSSGGGGSNQAANNALSSSGNMGTTGTGFNIPATPALSERY